MKKGIESLKYSVQKDTKEGEDCFNENGCDHEFTRMVPQDNPALLKMGIKQSCRRVSKCFHKYCDTYKWAMDRAKHYSEQSGKPIEEIIRIWEENRTSWYMSYYQDGNQPLSGRKPDDIEVLNVKERIVVLDNEVKTYESVIPTLTHNHQEAVRRDFEIKLVKSRNELEKCKSRLALYEIGFFTNF